MQSRILSVGRLVPRKGHTYLIEAIKKLVNEGMDIKLVIVGFGPEKERLQKQAEGLDCEIRSGISEEEVNDEYKKADLFVLPSVTDTQGERKGLGWFHWRPCRIGYRLLHSITRGRGGRDK